MNYANTVNSKYTMLNIKEISGLSALSSFGKSGPGYPLLSRSFSAVSPLFNTKTTKHQYE